MKHFERILAATIILGSLLTGCATTYDPETGTKTTRWDADATREVINTGFGVYDRYQEAQRQPRILGYSPNGTPIYNPIP